MKWYNCGPSWLGCFDRSLTAMGARSHLWAPAKPQWIKIMHGFGYVEWTWARDYCMFSCLILTTMLKLITTPFVENRFRDKVTWFLFHGIFPNSNYHPYTVKAYSKYTPAVTSTGTNTGTGTTAATTTKETATTKTPLPECNGWSARKKTWFGERTGWWPCAHSFFGLQRFSHWNVLKLPPLIRPGTIYWETTGK